jgi:hypothetical protein
MLSRPSRRAPKIGPRPLCILVHPNGRDDELAAAMRCLERLVPGARIVVAPAPPPQDCRTEVLVLDAGEAAKGPLAAAAALERGRTGRRPA